MPQFLQMNQWLKNPLLSGKKSARLHKHFGIKAIMMFLFEGACFVRRAGRRPAQGRWPCAGLLPARLSPDTNEFLYRILFEFSVPCTDHIASKA